MGLVSCLNVVISRGGDGECHVASMTRGVMKQLSDVRYPGFEALGYAASPLGKSNEDRGAFVCGTGSSSAQNRYIFWALPTSVLQYGDSDI